MPNPVKLFKPLKGPVQRFLEAENSHPVGKLNLLLSIGVWLLFGAGFIPSLTFVILRMIFANPPSWEAWVIPLVFVAVLWFNLSSLVATSQMYGRRLPEGTRRSSSRRRRP